MQRATSADTRRNTTLPLYPKRRIHEVDVALSFVVQIPEMTESRKLAPQANHLEGNTLRVLHFAKPRSRVTAGIKKRWWNPYRRRIQLFLADAVFAKTWNHAGAGCRRAADAPEGASSLERFSVATSTCSCFTLSLIIFSSRACCSDMEVKIL